MTAKELLEYELTQVGKQIDACLDGLDEAGMDRKCCPEAMTPREILVHLSEAYVAAMAEANGEKYEWGSFSVADQSTANVSSVFRDLRSRAIGALLNNEDDASQKSAYEYLIAHDNYHVGQLVLARLQIQPDWDSYAIYR